MILRFSATLALALTFLVAGCTTTPTPCASFSQVSCSPGFPGKEM